MPLSDAERIAYFERSFTNLTPDEKAIADIEEVRGEFKALVRTIVRHVPPGRCRALALTNLETSLMYAVKGIVGVDSRE